MLQRKPSLHETHPAILKRLKRAEGHLRSIMKMIETQHAISQAKKTLIHDHIDHCLKQSVTRGRGVLVQEFKEITKFL
jgi:DNA-binding FrmR family transcriptional regulator